jgi:hypothetical protein
LRQEAARLRLVGAETLDAAGGGEVLRALVAERVSARSLPHVRDAVEVLLSSLDQDAGLLGAAGLVLSQRFVLAA